MVEDSKEKTPSQQSPSDAEKKQAAPAVPVPRPVAAVTQAAPPRPVVVPPKPVTPSPAPAPQAPKSAGRRGFIKLIVAVGAVLSIVPFVPWGNFLLSSVSSSGAYKRQKVVLDLNTTANLNANGGAAGKSVNVNDLTSFPVDGKWLITYPSSGDLTLDSDNIDTFSKFQLVRLPDALGGSAKSASAFVALSKICVHLWCSPSYHPEKDTDPTNDTYQCPCHGSIYRPPDGLAIAGPASLQPAPTNAIPMLTLTADPNGDLYIEPPIWDVDHNGVQGYGRNYQSYQDYILPTAQGKS